MPRLDGISDYRIQCELGSTVTGVLYEAVHVVVPRRAAIKVVHPGRTGTFAVQLLREACLLEALAHPCLPQVFAIGKLADGRPWYAFEIIDGHTLRDRLRGGPMGGLDAARLIRDVAVILAHAHRRGVVHCGLQPDRIVFADRGGVAIPDWTTARVHDAPPRHAMQVQARSYLAPELVRGEVADDRADVFALGVIAYRALTGALPPEGDLSALRRTGIPPELATMIDQMLAFDRFDRPTCAELGADLDWLLAALANGPSVRIRRPRWTPAIPPSALVGEPSRDAGAPLASIALERTIVTKA